MKFSQTKFSALLGLVCFSFSASVAGSLDLVEQHLSARDNNVPFTSTRVSGKLNKPVDVSQTDLGAEQVKKLTGEDAHSSETPVSHCYLGHETAKIVRIRYDMSMVIDINESGQETFLKEEELKGVVLTASSGLYAQRDPTKGACAKALARHGDPCANNPYIIPNTFNDHGKGSGAATTTPAGKQKRDNNGGDTFDAKTNRGTITKRDDGTTFDSHVANGPVFKRDTDNTGADRDHICYDTVKRDSQLTKVVPTSCKNVPTSKSKGSSSAAGGGAGAGGVAGVAGNGGNDNDDDDDDHKLRFELVRADEAEGLWKQNIYDKNNNIIDSTNLHIDEHMSFWRAEYFCASCKPGNQYHTVLYESVEIEVDGAREDFVPELQCNGNAQTSRVHRKPKSQYSGKNNSGVEYSGTIFKVDRVTLGWADGKDNANINSYTKGASVSADGTVTPAGTGTGTGTSTEGKPDPNNKNPITKRMLFVEGPVF